MGEEPKLPLLSSIAARNSGEGGAEELGLSVIAIIKAARSRVPTRLLGAPAPPHSSEDTHDRGA